MDRVDAHLAVVIDHTVELVQVPVGEGEVDLHPEPGFKGVPDPLLGSVEGPRASPEGVVVFPVQAVHAHRHSPEAALRQPGGRLFREEGPVGSHGGQKPGVPGGGDEVEDVLPEEGFPAAEDEEAESRPPDGGDKFPAFGGGQLPGPVVFRPGLPVAVAAEQVAAACGVP